MSFLQRFKEPSSWAGVGILLSLVFPLVGLSGEAASAVTQALTAIAGAAAVVLKEKA